MKKIVLATGIFPPDIGGPATYCEKLAKELIGRGLEIKVICYSDVKKYGSYDFPVARISRRYPSPIRYLVYLWKLLAISKDVDLIYAQNPVSAGLPALLAARILKKKMVLKLVSDGAWEYYVTQVKDYDDPEKFQHKTYGFKTELLRRIQKISAKGASRIIVPSLYVKNIVSQWGVKQDRINVVYNAPKEAAALNLSKEEAKEKIGAKGDIIVSIGRLAPEKGFDTIISVLPDLLIENSDFKLLVVGEGEKRRDLELKIQELNLSNSVVMTGQVPSQDIPLYLKAADIFILDSQGEGLSHVILEAMQMGTPIIASRHGGNIELIEDSFNGFLVEYNNHNELTEAILELWQDKELQQKFVRNSYEKIKSFNWNDLVEKTLTILKTA